MKKQWAVAAGALLVVVACNQIAGVGSKPVSMAERFPGPWRTEPNIDVGRALAGSGVRGCGEYKYRASTTTGGEFLVHCSADGVSWSAYFVYIHSGKAMGPYEPDRSL